MKVVKAALAILLGAYSVFILLRYGAGMHDILPVPGFLLYIFKVVGAKLLFITALTAAAYGVGGFVFSRWLPGFVSLLEEALVKTALGLIVISYAVFALGLAGLLYPASGYVLLAACLGVGAKGITSFVKRVSQLSVSIKPTIPGVVLAGLALYLLIGGFYAALMPPTAFDVLMYHYGAPKLYIEAHRIFPTPDINGSSYPFGTEMLYLLAMLTESDISANLVNYFLCVGSGLIGYAFARRFVGRTSPLLTATMFFSVPVVYWLMPQAYVEFSQGFFLCAAVYAMVASFGEKGARWLYVSAAFIGMAMCVKYTSNLLLPVMLAGVAYKAYSLDRSGAKGAASAVLIYSAVALALVLPWYIRNLAYYGNPFFPMLAPAGSGGGSSGEMTQFWHRGMKGGPLDLLTVPWRVTMEPSGFYVNELNSLGPYFLMFIPGILIFRDVEKEAKYLVAFCLFYLAGWFLTAQSIRYLVPIAPYLALLAGYPICRLMKDKSMPARAAGYSMLALFCFSALAVNSSRAGLSRFPSSSPQAVDRYYSDNPNGYTASYDLWKYINSQLPEDAVIYQLWDDASVYFRHRKTIGFPANFGPTSRNKIHYIQGHNSFGGYLPGREIIANLKQMGAGYLLINTNREGRSVPEDPEFQQAVTIIAEDKGVFLFKLNP